MQYTEKQINKQAYQTPLIQVEKIALEQVIARSGGSDEVNVTEDEVSTPARSKAFNWGAFDDEE